MLRLAAILLMTLALASSADAQSRNSMKNARDDIEAAKKLPDFKPYEPSSPNMPEFNILAICGMGVKNAESECRFNQEYWRTVAEAFWPHASPTTRQSCGVSARHYGALRECLDAADKARR